MDATSRFFLGNRLAWFLAGFTGFSAGLTVGEYWIGAAAASAFVLLGLVIFDTDRAWWPREIRELPRDSHRSRLETRKVTVAAGLGCLAGILIGLVRPFG